MPEFFLVLLLTPLSWGSARLMMFYGIKYQDRLYYSCLFTWPLAACMLACTFGQFGWVFHRMSGRPAALCFCASTAGRDPMPEHSYVLRNSE